MRMEGPPNHGSLHWKCRWVRSLFTESTNDEIACGPETWRECGHRCESAGADAGVRARVGRYIVSRTGWLISWHQNWTVLVCLLQLNALADLLPIDALRSLRCITLHYTSLHYTSLHYTSLHYTSLHYTSLHYTSLHYTSLHYKMVLLLILKY